MGPNEPISTKLESRRIVSDLHPRIKRSDPHRRDPCVGEMIVLDRFFWGRRLPVGQHLPDAVGPTRTRCPAWPCPKWFEADWACAHPADALRHRPGARGARPDHWAATRPPPEWAESPLHRARDRVGPQPIETPMTSGPERPVGCGVRDPWKGQDGCAPWLDHRTFGPHPMPVP